MQVSFASAVIAKVCPYMLGHVARLNRVGDVHLKVVDVELLFMIISAILQPKRRYTNNN
jgi:hypothetical protein